MSEDAPRVVMVTAPAEAAEALARRLVEARAAACVNLLPGARSVYRWEGEVCAEGETLLVIKTTAGALPRLIGLVEQEHPYDLPEVIALPIEAGLKPYLEWIANEVRSS